MADNTDDLSMHPVWLTGDNYEVSAGKPSIFSQVSDAVTMGVPLTAISVARSFANTAKMIGSWVSGDEYKESKAEDWIKEVDSSGDMLKYYKEHSMGVEAAGLVAGSFIPGTLAAKAVKGAAGLKATGAFGRMLGYQDELVTAAREYNSMKAPLNVFQDIAKSKYAALAAGFGEQAVVAAAWETATIATMKANPTISQDGFMEMANHIFFGALTGGVIGGAASGFVMNSVLKKGLLNAETRELWQKHITDVGMSNTIAGDRALEIVINMDEALKKAAGTGAQREVERTADRAFQIVSSKLAAITPEHDRGAQDEFIKFLLRARTEGGLTSEDIYSKLGGLGAIRRVGFEDATNEGLAAARSVGPISPAGPKALREKNLDTGAWEYQEKTLPRFLNLKTGEETDTVLAQIGDLGKKIELSVDGKSLVVGEGQRVHSFPQASLGQGFGAALGDANPQAAQARFVWASKRGIKDTDFEKANISINDLPVMEELYKSWLTHDPLNRVSLKLLDNEGKLIDGGGGAVGDFERSDIAGYLLEAKQRIARNLIEAGHSADDVAMRVNTPVEKLPELFLAGRGQIDDFIRDIDEVTSLNHVALQYEARRMADVDGNIVYGMMEAQQRIELAAESAQTATRSFLDLVGADVPDQFFASKTALQADSLGAAPSFLGNRDPDPKSLAAMAQNVGAAFKKLFERMKTDEHDLLNAPLAGLHTNAAAGAEVALIDNVMRGTGEKFKLIRMDGPDGAKWKQAIDRAGVYIPENTKGFLVRKGLDVEADGYSTGSVVNWKLTGNFATEERYVMPRDQFIPAGDGQPSFGMKGKYHVYPIEHQESVDFMSTHIKINDARQTHNANFARAAGMPDLAARIEGGIGNYYAPPMDTSRYKHVVWVREPIGKGGASSETHAVVATSAESLQSKIDEIKRTFPEYDIYTKEQIAREFKNRGEFDASLNMNQAVINDKLARKGIISDIIPDINPSNLSDNYLRWHSQQTRRLLESYTELGNGQLFAELRHMADQYSDVAKSKVGFIASKLGVKEAKNPFQEFIDTMLDRSSTHHAPLWQDLNEKAEALYNTAFRKATSAFQDASKGLASWQDASATAERFGLGNPYRSLESMTEVSQRIKPSELAALVRTGNSIIAATQVRLDAFQSLINIVSTPVLLMAQASNAKFKMMQDLTTVQLPGSQLAMPSGTKALYSSVARWWGPSKDALLEEYTKRGFIPELNGIKNYHAMLEDLATAPGSNEFGKKLSSAVDKAAVLTGSNWAENFTRFVTADVGKQLYEAQGLVGEEMWAAVRTFVNRTQGNYIASQRPIVFQGVLGQAVGLFQTYQFNLMQQLFRFIGEGDKRSLATLGAMQTSLYGMQGVPGFNVLNTHIVGNAAGNYNHNDIYTGVNSFAGKEVADWLMYGSLSNILDTGLYTRGDINPRQATVLPINPADWPAISGARRFLENVAGTAGKLANGGDVFKSLLFGIEHNGLSRPLAGAAQLVQGYSTTSQGSLISAVDWNSISNASRIFGSRPLDEATAMDAMYRKTLYDATNLDRIKKLGATVRTQMLGGEEVDLQELSAFQAKYTMAGGRAERFGAFITDSMKKANTAAANDVIRHLNSPGSRYVYSLMGGQTLPDYTNVGSTEAAAPQ